jgi:hypothetical protein
MWLVMTVGGGESRRRRSRLPKEERAAEGGESCRRRRELPKERAAEGRDWYDRWWLSKERNLIVWMMASRRFMCKGEVKRGAELAADRILRLLLQGCRTLEGS